MQLAIANPARGDVRSFGKRLTQPYAFGGCVLWTTDKHCAVTLGTIRGLNVGLKSRPTGQRQTRRVCRSGGRFEDVTAQLLKQGFGLSWAEYIPDIEATNNEQGTPAIDSPEATTGNRWKYTCPGCALNAWTKPHASLMCGECDEDMISENDI